MYRASLLCAAAALVATALAPVGDGTTAPDPQDPKLARFYRQRIDWGRCPSGYPASMRCGHLDVPLDYTDPAKGTVALAVARRPATGRHRLGSLVLNYGGPGGAGLPSLAKGLTEPERALRYRNLAASYDLVTFDPRGVGGSAPISCAGALPVRRTESMDAAALLRASDAAVRSCRAHSGPVLPHVGTVNVARDMDVLRQALGERKLDYLGWSYGTRLGAVYAARFPERAGRMVLDGVDTLSEPLADQELETARGQQIAYDAFLDWCARQPGCVYEGVDRARANRRTGELVARLDANPLPVPGGGRFTGADLALAIENDLYSPWDWPDLERGLGTLVRHRDPAGLLEAAQPEKDNEGAAWAAVSCADYPDRGAGGDPRALQRQLDELRPRFLEASRIFGPGELSEIAYCHGWPTPTDPTSGLTPENVPPMLLIGVRGDPATPYAWTEETARLLGPRAIVIDYKGQGHTGFRHSACVKRHVERFLLDGRLPRESTSCPALGIDARGHEVTTPAPQP
ncbi:alpha/beta hydrolase [Streptomyces sp. NBC_01276]|uniref:alpha/beta hydrolase n=1 Tax=Streptomyces sp. NBC_01276 TaxID=2903808 RepID=UPI00352FC840